MKNRRSGKSVRILLAARRYLSFFLLISFVVTCCMLLFLLTWQGNTELDPTRENIELAAKLTFGNVLLVSLLFTVIDEIRRWFAVTRPVRYIVRAMEKIMNGDFSVSSELGKGSTFTVKIRRNEYGTVQADTP